MKPIKINDKASKESLLLAILDACWQYVDEEDIEHAVALSDDDFDEQLEEFYPDLDFYGGESFDQLCEDMRNFLKKMKESV